MLLICHTFLIAFIVPIVLVLVQEGTVAWGYLSSKRLLQLMGALSAQRVPQGKGRASCSLCRLHRKCQNRQLDTSEISWL